MWTAVSCCGRGFSFGTYGWFGLVWFSWFGWMVSMREEKKMRERTKENSKNVKMSFARFYFNFIFVWGKFVGLVYFSVDCFFSLLLSSSICHILAKCCLMGCKVSYLWNCMLHFYNIYVWIMCRYRKKTHTYKQWFVPANEIEWEKKKKH